MGSPTGGGPPRGKEVSQVGITDGISETISEHADEIKAGIDKVGDRIDSATGGKFAGKVDQAQEFLKEKVPDKD